MLAGCALAAAAVAAPAQTLPPPQNVLQLQTTGSIEVQQDLLQITLTTARDGTDPAQVQSQLRTALDAALTEAKRNAQPGQLDVRTGNFAIYPRNNREGRISGWTGTAETLERAIAADPDFALAHVARARLHSFYQQGDLARQKASTARELVARRGTERER